MILFNRSRTRQPAYNVSGLVLIVPLMISLTNLGGTGVVLAIASSAWGVWVAARHGNRRLTVMAVVATLLNLVSTVMLSTPSILMALGYIAWIYAYPALSEWLYWRG